jgi:hypothetical protein
MKTIFETTTRATLQDRLGRLAPDSKPGFGKLNVNQMVVHCTGGIDMLIGRLKVAPRPGPLRNPLLRYLIIYVLPWPHGAPTAPELIPPTDPGDFGENVAKLREAIERIGTESAEGVFDPHPAFGALKGKDVGVLVARHLDHHLRQFGV